MPMRILLVRFPAAFQPAKLADGTQSFAVPPKSAILGKLRSKVWMMPSARQNLLLSTAGGQDVVGSFGHW